MSTTARVRASVQLLENPLQNAPIVESLGSATPVEILDDQGAWLKIKASRSAHAISGWVMRQALAFPPADDAIFPSIKLEDGKSIPAVPRSLKAADLLAWHNTPDQPRWIPETVWGKVNAGEQQTIVSGIRGAIQQRQNEWDAWVAGLSASNRQEDARIEEWVATLRGGMDVWTLRPEMIYTEASQDKGHLGWAIESDIMQWTGQVKRNDQEPKYKTWYEVSLYKTNKLIKGWYKADLLDPYIFPSEENDTGIETNGVNQFDLGTTMLRHPADPEIADAIAANRNGYQYIDVFNAFEKHKIHHNLCGEFCAATLAGVDVIPLLKKWKAVDDAKVTEIMRDDEGTGLGDVKAMLSLFDLEFEEYRYAPSVTPVSPIRLLNQLKEGKMAFSGVGIFKANGKLCGKESGGKTTRHWVILEDVIPVGNSGWARIYNPFRNREEVYTYELFIQSVGQFGIGLWVNMKA